MESDEYEMTDSEDDYTKDDKMLLEYARDSMKKKEISSDEEVYGFGETDSEAEEEEEVEDDEDDDVVAENDDIDMGSDIEEEEKLPDDRAWGKKKKSFYNTDFIDQDYEGIYQGKEAEIAELEEQEAKTIQKRLVEKLHDADFSITDALDLAKTTQNIVKEEIIETDLSKLTKRQKLDLVKKESPEFFILIQDFKDKMEEAKRILPLIKYFKGKVKKSFAALDYLQIKFSIILNYCTNLSFYLYLKAKRIPIKNHPILKSLFRYRQLLQQMTEIGDKIIEPQIDPLLEMIKSGKKISLDSELLSKKKTVKSLSHEHQQNQKKLSKKGKTVDRIDGRIKEDNEDADSFKDLDEEMSSEFEEIKSDDLKKSTVDPEEKRAITYEMAKNKGLTPKRKKELRNPRVKNRKKYEKAKIRRKGQVRIPRKEIPVYGGEATGIKIGLTKSVRIK